jgi:hypothetical protein
MIGSCGTNEQGWCTIRVKDSDERSRHSQLVGVVVGQHGDVLYIPDVGQMDKVQWGLGLNCQR